MQDPLTSSFRWGETFDTAPLYQRLLRQAGSTTDAQTERPYSGLLVSLVDERGGAACECAGGAPSGWFVGTAVRVSGAVCRRVGHGVPAVSGRCRDGCI